MHLLEAACNSSLQGCDEVANQMEEPFALMPLDDIMCTYERDINRWVGASGILAAATHPRWGRRGKGHHPGEACYFRIF